VWLGESDTLMGAVYDYVFFVKIQTSEMLRAQHDQPNCTVLTNFQNIYTVAGNDFAPIIVLRLSVA
jgi:hypothetical protein